MVLVLAATKEQFITLKFHSLITECSYDYVYVYDGDSFNSRLLGSFSGKTVPEKIIATSGFVRIFLCSYLVFFFIIITTLLLQFD